MTASKGTTSPAATTMVQLEFSDFVDLQTRLVLLPRIEEEGRGAVVASFINNNNNGRTDKHDADHIATTKDKDENTPKEMQLKEEKEKNNATSQEDPSSLEETVKKEKMTDESSSSKVEHPKEEFSNDNDDDASGCGSDNNNEESEKMNDDNVSVSSVPEHAVPTSETMSRGDTPMIKQTSLLDEEEEEDEDEDEDEEELADNSETTNEKEEGSSSSVQSKPQEEDTDNVCASTASSIEEKTHRNNDNNKEEEKENTKNQEEVIEEIHVMGKMLVGIGGKNSDNNDDNIAEMDFTDILSAIRQAPTPIILHFEPQPLILEEEEKSNKDTTINMIAVTSSQDEEAIIKEKEVICDDDDGTASSNTQPQEEEEDVDSDDNEEEAADAVTETQSFQAAAIRGTLSSWGSRLKVEAGPTFASLSSAAARAAAEVSERASKVRSAADQQQQEQKTQTDTAEETCRNQTNTSSSPSITLKTKPPCCGLFLQSSGKFIPLDATARVASSTSSHNNNKNSPLPKVTNSSILIVRGTAQPDPTKQFSFQWCRSYTVEERKSGSTDGSKTSETSQDGVVREWVTLDGATFSAFQPSASDIGHRLRCVVTITKAPSKVDNDESDSDDDDEDEKLDEEREAEEEKVICELPEPVTADMSLFNGARTALLKGAKFNNMKGRGNANDRTFKINFEISSHAQAPSPKNGMKKKTLTSAMSIFQVSGSTAEPMHEDKIMSTSAISAPSHPKQFELYFPIGLPSSASMVSALSTENGRFQLEAPNRITRETFLMALGIANFQGRPADLNEKTVLYPKCDYDVDNGDDVSPPTKEFSASDSESVKSDMDDSTSESSSVQAAKGSIVEATDSGSTTPSDDVDKLKSLSPKIDSSAVDDERKIQELERELERDLRTMQNKLAKKDKTVTKLQKQLTKSNTKLTQSAKDMKDYRRKIDESNKSLRLAEKRIATHEDTIARMKKDSASHVSTLESRIDEQSVTLAEMEKLVRSLQNEKAVLSAAVDARDSKLSKMGTLQAAVDSLSVEVSKGDVIRADLHKSNKKCKDLQDELKKAQALENQRREELEESQRKVKELELSIANECKKTAACQAKVDTLQTQTQKLKSERNSSRQKADSLSKELSRICKNGMSLTDVEHIIQDDEARRFEVSLLREQKRKALEELDLYRTAFDQSLAAQQKAGINGEAVRALEQKSELERVVADLTEYVNAKEMQLETMKEVNQALQLELHQLAQKKTFDKNDI